MSDVWVRAGVSITLEIVEIQIMLGYATVFRGLGMWRVCYALGSSLWRGYNFAEI